jgi:isopenicillin N synthase-like dioxygenase
LKEGYYVGIETPADDERAKRLINVGPNVWPDGQPEFQPVMLRYFDAMSDLASLIMEGIALSLNLDNGYFQTFCANPLATLRLLHYPPQPANPQPGEKGCGAHTDFGGITILMQDSVGGLEVWDHDEGAWIQAEPLAGGFIVNLGDLMERWTNQRYRSTVHRVINRSGKERYSVPFFFSGNHDYLISCLPGCLEKGEKPRFPPVTVDAHIRQKYAETYGGATVAVPS